MHKVAPWISRESKLVQYTDLLISSWVFLCIAMCSPGDVAALRRFIKPIVVHVDEGCLILLCAGSSIFVLGALNTQHTIRMRLWGQAAQATEEKVMCMRPAFYTSEFNHFENKTQVFNILRKKNLKW